MEGSERVTADNWDGGIQPNSDLPGVIDSIRRDKPQLKSVRAPKDSDHDGMPDRWEKRHHLDPNDPSDGQKISADGVYTNLEVYLASLAE